MNQEPVENLEKDHVLDIDADGKLHVLYGGTKVVQHTPPSKTGAGLKGIVVIYGLPVGLYILILLP